MTDDECAVTDGSDSENDTQPLQKRNRRLLCAKKTSILSMKLKGKRCPKHAQPLQVTQIRQRMLTREMAFDVWLGMLYERRCNERWWLELGGEWYAGRVVCQADQGWDECYDKFWVW